MIPLEWKLAAAGAVAAAALGGWAYVSHLQHAAADAKVADQRATVAEAATTAVDRVQTRTIIVHDKQARAEDAIRQAPGADAPVPPAVLDSWRASVDGLRDTSSASDDPNKPAG